jgi:hypothetical protein
MNVTKLEQLLRIAEGVDEIILEIEGEHYFVGGIALDEEFGQVIIKAAQFQDEGPDDSVETTWTDESEDQGNSVCAIPQHAGDGDDLPRERQA